MKATVTWLGEARFSAVADSGHEVLIDGPPDLGGHNRGTRPMELMLMGMASCTAFDVMHILRRGRQQVASCVAEVEAERDTSDPMVFRRIHVSFVVTGTALSEDRVRRAIDLSAEKYCSASIMLRRAGVDISHSFTVQPSQ